MLLVKLRLDRCNSFKLLSRYRGEEKKEETVYSARCHRTWPPPRQELRGSFRPKDIFSPWNFCPRSFHPRGGVSVLVQQVREGGHILRPLAPEEKISGGGNIL